MTEHIDTPETDPELVAIEAEWERVLAESNACSADTDRFLADQKVKMAQHEEWRKNFDTVQAKQEGPIARFVGNIFLVIHFIILGWATINFLNDFSNKKD